MNTFGDGPYSSATAIIAAVVPDQPGAPTTTDTGSSSIEIDWNPPASDGGSAITSYTVYIQKSDTTWATEVTYCDGSDSTIMTNTLCTIPVSTL